MAKAIVRTVRPKASDTPSSPIPTSGNAAARTALPQPPRTSQNVPINSAPIFLVIVIFVTRHPIEVRAAHAPRAYIDAIGKTCVPDRLKHGRNAMGGRRAHDEHGPDTPLAEERVGADGHLCVGILDMRQCFGQVTLGRENRDGVGAHGLGTGEFSA